MPHLRPAAPTSAALRPAPSILPLRFRGAARRMPSRRTVARHCGALLPRCATAPCRVGGSPFSLLLRPPALLRLPRTDLGDPLRDGDLEPLRWLARIVEPLDHYPRQPLSDRPL